MENRELDAVGVDSAVDCGRLDFKAVSAIFQVGVFLDSGRGGGALFLAAEAVAVADKSAPGVVGYTVAYTE